MGESILNRHFPFTKRCEICQKPSHNLYEINLDGYPVYVCSEAHAIEARNRWMKHKEMGGPQIPVSEDEPIMNSGGLPAEEVNDL